MHGGSWHLALSHECDLTSVVKLVPTGRGSAEFARNHLLRCHTPHCYLKSAVVFLAVLWKKVSMLFGETLRNFASNMCQQADVETSHTESTSHTVSFRYLLLYVILNLTCLDEHEKS